MSGVEAIPVEILMMIFKNLKIRDAVACRAVCRHWRDAVDSLSDDAWKDFCHRDFCNPEEAKHVSNLSYRDLYKSLALWSKVEQADEKCPTKPVNCVSWFKVLNNNKVAVFRFFHIEYYNIQTMTLISHRPFNFNIYSFDENEYLIAILKADNSNIHVIIKSNEREFVVGRQDPKDRFTLLDTELYFKSRQDKMCVARLKVVDGEETVETVKLHDLREQVVAFARAGEDEVNVLTEEGNIYSYCYTTTGFTWSVQLKDDNVTDFIYVELRRFGFQWSNAIIYDWLSYKYSEKQLQITKRKPTAIHSHNHVLLLGTDLGSVNVYKRPYNENGELNTYKSNPDRVIDVKKIQFDHGIHVGCCIVQVDVVETLYGHRLLVLFSSRWFLCVELLHKQVNVITSAKKGGDVKKMAARHSVRAARPMKPARKPRLL